MAAGEIYLTKDGYEKLVEKLKHLKTVRRRELSKAIGEARDHGDISENAEYDSAKDAQALNELKIAELEDKLARVRVLENENIPDDRVIIGATVKLEDMHCGEQLEYTLVSEIEADYAKGWISITSPIGRGLVSRKENEVVDIKIPAGMLKYKILKISR